MWTWILWAVVGLLVVALGGFLALVVAMRTKNRRGLGVIRRFGRFGRPIELRTRRGARRGRRGDPPRRTTVGRAVRDADRRVPDGRRVPRLPPVRDRTWTGCVTSVRQARRAAGRGAHSPGGAAGSSSRPRPCPTCPGGTAGSRASSASPTSSRCGVRRSPRAAPREGGAPRTSTARSTSCGWPRSRTAGPGPERGGGPGRRRLPEHGGPRSSPGPAAGLPRRHGPDAADEPRGRGSTSPGRSRRSGPDVAGLRPGDRVWADLFESGHGALADRVRVPASALSPLPDAISFDDAATAPHSGTLALQRLRAARADPAGRARADQRGRRLRGAVRGADRQGAGGRGHGRRPRRQARLPPGAGRGRGHRLHPGGHHAR